MVNTVRQLLYSDDVQLSQNHHNCIMTKFPGYSSETHWHQDIRYWSYDRPELINVWLALGEEHRSRRYAVNSGVAQDSVGSRTLRCLTVSAHRFGRKPGIVKTAVSADLNTGDVLFFHCRAFHAAGANNTTSPKYSLVFSYHASDNAPIPNTRSARYAEVSLPAGSVPLSN